MTTTAPTRGGEPAWGDRFAGYLQVVTPVDYSPASWQAVGLGAHFADTFVARQRVVHVRTRGSATEAEAVETLRLGMLPTRSHVDVDIVCAPTVPDGVLPILREADRSLLTMSTHGHTALAESLVGSTAHGMLREWNGPIVAIGPHYAPSAELRRIVVCVEPLLATPRALLGEVRTWAAYLDLPVTVFAVTSDNLPFERARNDARVADIAKLVSLPGRPASVAGSESGSVPGNIVEYADATPGTLIAVAPRLRGAAERLLLGSVAMSVCRRSTSPVLMRRLEP